MSQRTGVIARVFKTLRNSLGGSQSKNTLVGTDFFGNNYHEKEKTQNRRGSRWVEAEDGDQTRVPDVPPEWDAWLRGRRKLPPSHEELARNHALMMRTIQRAMDLEQKEFLEGPPSSTDNEASYTSTVNPGDRKSQSDFPVYPEYETVPGEKKKKT